MSRFSDLLALVALLPALACAESFSSHMSARPCLSTCRFKLCPPTSLSLSTPHDTPATSPICLANTALGLVQLDEALLLTGSKPIPLSQIREPGLEQAFSPSFLKAYALPSGASAVGHEVSQQGQATFLAGKCVALPVLEYQRVEMGIVVENVQLETHPLVDCVVVHIATSETPKPTTTTDTPELSASPSMTPGPFVTTNTPDVSVSASMTPGDPSTSATMSADPSVIAETPNPSTSATISPDPSVTTKTPGPSTSATMSPDPSITTETPGPSTSATISPEPSASASMQPDPSTTATMTPRPTVTATASPDISSTIEFPPTTKIGEKTTFSFKVTVSRDSGTSEEDLYLLTDSTSSMQGAVEKVQEGFRAVVNARKSASSKVAFGVGYYKDENNDDLFANVQPITLKTSLVIASINALMAPSSVVNVDFDEANLVALYRVATLDEIGWRDGSRRILVHVGDAPGHEPTCVEGLPRLTREKIIDALKKKKISVVAASLTSSGRPGLNNEIKEIYECANATTAPPQQATAITGQTGGKVLEVEDEEKLIETILSLVGSLPQDLDADVSDCEAAGVDVSFSPKLPLSIAAGMTVTITETVSVNRDVCGAGGSGFSCKVIFTRSGAAAGVQTLKSSGISGC